MTRKKQPSVLKRYMLSYIFVFSIPLILLVFLINTIYIQNIREDITQLNETYLTQLDAELDRTFDDLHVCVILLIMKIVFQPVQFI